MTLPSTGYVAPRLATLRDDLRAAVWAEIGASVNLDSGSLLGNLIDIVAARLDELAEGVQGAYDALDERLATGVYLDNLCALVGVTREPAAYSIATLTLTAAAGPAVVVPAGSIARDPSTGVEWITTAAATIPGGGTITVAASPALTGPITAGPATITSIVTPVTGWTAVTNAAAATPGQDRETDDLLRARRRESLQITGAASTSAIASALRELSYITTAIVTDNRTDYPAAVAGVTLLPHSLLTVIYPAASTSAQRQEIAQILWDRAPAGIYHNSGAPLTSHTGTVTDASGLSQTVRWADAGSEACTVAIEITVDSTYGGAAGSGGAGDLALKAALVAMVDALPVGTAPRALDVYRTADTIPGVLNVTDLTITGSPTAFEKATLLAAAVTITPTP